MLCLLGGFLAAMATARSLAEPLDGVRDALARVRDGDLGAGLVVDDGGEVGEVQAGFNQMVEGLRERRRLRDLFGRHVGQQVATNALERGTGLGGQQADASVIFVDLVGSTAMAEVLPPDEVVETLNDFFGVVVRTIDGQGGWVNKFEGDGALCIFGVPGTQPDHPARVLRAARELHRAPRHAVRAHPGLEAGIGVSSGQVVAGNVGTEARYEYTVIGPAVNEAARLTDVAKGRRGQGAGVERRGAPGGRRGRALARRRHGRPARPPRPHRHLRAGRGGTRHGLSLRRHIGVIRGTGRTECLPSHPPSSEDHSMRKFIAAAALAAATAVGGMAAVPTLSGASARTDGSPAACGASRSARGLEVVGLAGDRLVCFRADRPSRERDIGRVRGLQQDTKLVGIDYRPANGVLYGVGDQGGVYTVDVTNARVTLAVRSTVPLRGMSFGVDFNPAADRLRVVSDAGQNLRINVADGTTIADGDLNITPGTAATGIVGAAYTNNDADPNTATTLFDVDSLLDQVEVQSPPNNGSLVATGKLGVDTGPEVGADIYTELRNGTAVGNTAYAALRVSGRSTFYAVDLLTGRASPIGNFDRDLTLTGIAIPLDQR